VLPSKFDGRPNIIMEANAAGVPVIAAPVGGVPEMIVDGQNGYLLKPSDTSAIGDIVERWLADSSSLRDLKIRSRTFAEDRFDVREMMNAYARVFDELVG
jgi:glycosyltransferase involved in cell wall biosynthesis